jgi:hypothetical protein
MYDNVVKDLREISGNRAIPVHMAKTAKEAADAIEELMRRCEQFQYMPPPAWITVTEQKPKTDDIVIVAIHDDSGDTPYDVTNVGFYLDVFPLGIWVVENERCNYVTHWMPLPSTEGLNET